MKIQIRRISLLWYFSLAFPLMAGAPVVCAEESPEQRLNTTSQGQNIQRGSVGGGTISHDEFEPLITVGDRKSSSRASGQQNLSAGQSQSTHDDFWFYDVDEELFADLDRDGYYRGIDLTFDADTYFSAADVYAVIYLSYEYGPWNEFVVTENFTIFGASGDDEYFIESELVSGYPTGDYDILIELFDAYDGAFVASIGPDESSELSFLPLEDAGRDTPFGTTIIVNHGGGGSFSWFALMALLGVVGFARQLRLVG